MNISGNNSAIETFYYQCYGCHLFIKMLEKPKKDPPCTYDNSTVSLRIESTWRVVKTTTTRKDLWLLFLKQLKKEFQK